MEEMGDAEFESPTACREPSGLSPTMQWSPGTGLTLLAELEPSPPGVSSSVRAGRATHVP